MHQPDYENNKLLYKCEVLRSRLKIRDFFLKTSVREVYENIGQVLSLVRIQLALSDPQKTDKIVANISSSGDLVEQTIKDLRTMCRSFYPDNDILQEGGFVESLNSVIKILWLHTDPAIQVKGISKDIPAELKLYIFRILLEVFRSIKDIEGELNDICITHADEAITFIIDYKGEDVQLGENRTKDEKGTYLSFNERIELIEGSFHIKEIKEGKTRITLQIPLNVFYE